MARDFRKLIVWQASIELAEIIHKMTAGYPKEETYGMISQVRRATYSISANIAEGSGKSTNKDYLKYLHIAKGSLNETESYLELSRRLKYIDIQQYLMVIGRCKALSIKLNNLMARVAAEV